MNEPTTNASEFSVSEISSALKNTIEDIYGHVRIRGEVGRLTRPGSGHVYFDLKDDKAVLAAVAWKGVAGRWRFQPEQGLEVIVTGKLTTFAGQSKYQIIVDNVEPAGVGALMALLEERRKKLAAEGLFDRERKKELPYLPRVIGVATSPTGAVIRDILHRLADRFPTQVVVWPCRVQGENCAPEIAAAVRGFNSFAPDGPIPRPDLIIVARGGGSIEDLWGFNEEAVVRAVAESDIPVISAVGHETDTTLIDYAADMRAPTPTGAAEVAVPVRSELIAYVEDLGQRQRNGTRRIASAGRDRLRAAAAGLPRPAELLSNARQRLDFAGERLAGGLRAAGQKKAIALARIAPRLSATLLRQRNNDYARQVDRLTARLPQALTQAANRAQTKFTPIEKRLAPAMTRTLADRQQRLAASAKLLETLSYKSILGRGFSLVTDDAGNLVRSAEKLSPGAQIGLEFADGKRSAIIDGKAGVPKKPKAPKSTAKQDIKPADKGQSSLF